MNIPLHFGAISIIETRKPRLVVPLVFACSGEYWTTGTSYWADIVLHNENKAKLYN